MKKNKHSIPVVRIASLLSFSLFTLLGVLAGLPPEVVLTRVSIGTGIVLLITLAGVKFAGLLTTW